MKNLQQGVPPLRAASGARVNADVEPKTIVRLREIETATARAIKIHLAGVYKFPATAKT